MNAKVKPPLETWVSGSMPKHKGETLYVFRHELKACCADVQALSGARKALPWYFVLASGGASLALTGTLGLLAFFGAPKGERPEQWLVYVYGVMVAVGATAAVILFIVGLLAKGSYDDDVDAIVNKLRDMEYVSDEGGASP